jgi:hypothetical protein
MAPARESPSRNIDGSGNCRRPGLTETPRETSRMTAAMKHSFGSPAGAGRMKLPSCADLCERAGETDVNQ